MSSCLGKFARLAGGALLVGSLAGGAVAQSSIQLTHTPVTVSMEPQPIIAEIRIQNNRMEPDIRRVPPAEGQQYWLFAVELLNTGQTPLEAARMIAKTVEGNEVVLLTPLAIGGYMRGGAARIGAREKRSLSLLAIVPAGTRQIKVNCVTCENPADLLVALP